AAQFPEEEHEPEERYRGSHQHDGPSQADHYRVRHPDTRVGEREQRDRRGEDDEAHLLDTLLPLRLHHRAWVPDAVRAEIAESAWREVEEGEQAKRQAHAGGTDADVPSHLLTEEAGHQLAEERAGVDAHVEDREASVASRTAVRVQV